MNMNAVLKDVLTVLYPQVGYDKTLEIILIGLIFLSALCLVVAVFSRFADDVSLAGAVVFGILAFVVGDIMLTNREDRLIQELVNDPAALEVVLEIRRGIEWVNDPKRQRNKENL